MMFVVLFGTFLSPIHMPLPTEEQWKYIADDFCTKWNIPNCMGAIDGKHVKIQATASSISLFYNYNPFFNSASGSHSRRL